MTGPRSSAAIVAIAVAAAAAAWAPPARAGDPKPPAAAEIETCTECHGDATFSKDLPSGEKQALFIDRKAFERSAHGAKLRCTDCHKDVDPEDTPHKLPALKSRREYTIAYYEACKRCHFANYTKTLDSVHHELLAKQDLRAPTCVDCHGSHEVTAPGEPRSRISKTCARCHKEVSAAYERSVHGRALTEGNPDVPVCTDCHRAHDVADPRTPQFRHATPALCGSCHGDPQRMDKYRLSTKVVDTYVADFHGTTMALRGPDAPTATALMPTCTDCHGVHDIRKCDEPGSGVMQKELQKTCAKCHPDATENFPAAWMSHYEPTFKKAPLVAGVKLVYSIMIPLMVAGLVLQILLHIWRVVVNR